MSLRYMNKSESSYVCVSLCFTSLWFPHTLHPAKIRTTHNNDSRNSGHLYPSYLPFCRHSAALSLPFSFFNNLFLCLPHILSLTLYSYPFLFVLIYSVTLLHLLWFVSYAIIFLKQPLCHANHYEHIQPVRCLIAGFINVNWSSRNGKRDTLIK